MLSESIPSISLQEDELKTKSFPLSIQEINELLRYANDTKGVSKQEEIAIGDIVEELSDPTRRVELEDGLYMDAFRSFLDNDSGEVFDRNEKEYPDYKDIVFRAKVDYQITFTSGLDWKCSSMYLDYCKFKLHQQGVNPFVNAVSYAVKSLFKIACNVHVNIKSRVSIKGENNTLIITEDYYISSCFADNDFGYPKDDEVLFSTEDYENSPIHICTIYNVELKDQLGFITTFVGSNMVISRGSENFSSSLLFNGIENYFNLNLLATELEITAFKQISPRLMQIAIDRGYLNNAGSGIKDEMLSYLDWSHYSRINLNFFNEIDARLLVKKLLLLVSDNPMYPPCLMFLDMSQCEFNLAQFICITLHHSNLQKVKISSEQSNSITSPAINENIKQQKKLSEIEDSVEISVVSERDNILQAFQGKAQLPDFAILSSSEQKIIITCIATNFKECQNIIQSVKQMFSCEYNYISCFVDKHDCDKFFSELKQEIESYEGLKSQLDILFKVFPPVKANDNNSNELNLNDKELIELVVLKYHFCRLYKNVSDLKGKFINYLRKDAGNKPVLFDIKEEDKIVTLLYIYFCEVSQCEQGIEKWRKLFHYHAENFFKAYEELRKLVDETGFRIYKIVKAINNKSVDKVDGSENFTMEQKHFSIICRQSLESVNLSMAAGEKFPVKIYLLSKGARINNNVATLALDVGSNIGYAKDKIYRFICDLLLLGWFNGKFQVQCTVALTDNETSLLEYCIKFYQSCIMTLNNYFLPGIRDGSKKLNQEISSEICKQVLSECDLLQEKAESHDSTLVL